MLRILFFTYVGWLLLPHIGHTQSVVPSNGDPTHLGPSLLDKVYHLDYHEGYFIPMDKPAVRKDANKKGTKDAPKKRERLANVSKKKSKDQPAKMLTIYKLDGLISEGDSQQYFYKYPILQQKKLTDAETQELVGLLQDSALYLLDNNNKLSVFLPEVGVQLHEDLFVFASFRSNQILFRHKGKLMMEDIDPGRHRLLAFIEKHLDGFERFRYAPNSANSGENIGEGFQLHQGESAEKAQQIKNIVEGNGDGI